MNLTFRKTHLKVSHSGIISSFAFLNKVDYILTECRKTPEKGQKHCEHVDSKNDREALEDPFSVSHFVLFFKTTVFI